MVFATPSVSPNVTLLKESWFVPAGIVIDAAPPMNCMLPPDCVHVPAVWLKFPLSFVVATVCVQVLPALSITRSPVSVSVLDVEIV